MKDNFSLELEKFLDRDDLVVKEIPSTRKEKTYGDFRGAYEVIHKRGYAIYQNGDLKFTLINEYSYLYTSKWSYDCGGAPSSKDVYYCVVNDNTFRISGSVYDKAGEYTRIQQRKNLDRQKQNTLNFIRQRS